MNKSKKQYVNLHQLINKTKAEHPNYLYLYIGHYNHTKIVVIKIPYKMIRQNNQWTYKNCFFRE